MTDELPSAESDAPCTHPYWNEEGDGHGHNSWRCTTCGRSQWIAPWVLRTRPIPPARSCACGCGCEPDGDWHWSQQPWCPCVANGCPCVTDSRGDADV